MARFNVEYTIRGRASETIEADTLEHAKQIAQSRCEDENFLPELYDVDDIDCRVAEFHPVTRNGKEIWTTYVLRDDVPGHGESA
jgi:hypothetical protein